jgi:hypothetical protein
LLGADYWKEAGETTCVTCAVSWTKKLLLVSEVKCGEALCKTLNMGKPGKFVHNGPYNFVDFEVV